MKNKILFLKKTGIYTFSNLLNSGIPFLLLPILTSYLSPEAYAKVDIFMLMYQFFIPLVGLNAFAGLSRYYFDVSNDQFRTYVGNAFMIILLILLAVIIIVFPFRNLINKYTTLPIAWIFVAIYYAFANNIIRILLNIWQVKYKAVNYGIFRVSRTLLDIAASLLLIVFLKYQWEGRIMGQVFAVSLFLLVAIFILFKKNYIILKVDKTRIKELLQYGLPLVPHTLSAVIITYSDRLFITNILSLEETGYYSVGYQVGMIVYLIQASFNQVWTPWLFESLKKQSSRIRMMIVKSTYLYFVAILALALITAYIAPYIYKLFIDKDYAEGLKYVIWIAMGFAFNGMYKIVSGYIFYLKKTYIIAIVTISIALLNITLNYFLINEYGGIGAAQASSISFFVEFILIWIISAKVYKMPWLFFLKKS